MVIPYYCEDYPENPDNLKTDNDIASPDAASNDATPNETTRPTSTPSQN